MITSLLLPLLLQVGPNPATGEIPGVPEELANRPPRPLAQEPAAQTSPWLEECLGYLDTDPARAHSIAQIRLRETAGTDRVLANHCLGLAATELGRWGEARAAFIAARDGTPAGEASMRARFGAMAGNAALGGGDPGAAVGLFEQARKDAGTAGSTDLEALASLDRARALVDLDRVTEATTDLISARDMRPRDAEIRLLLATLLRRQGEYDPAQSEIEAAATLAPESPAVALEAGVIAVLDGREDAARKSWQSVIELAPGSPEATTAQGYIAQLDEGAAAQ